MRGPALTLLLKSALADSAQLPPAEAPTAGDRILVVAPHPDDETLCCAGYLRRALAAGATVGIVWMTAGDGFELDAFLEEHHLRLKGRGMQQLGWTRLTEAFDAARILGVPDTRRWMLGYPDRGLAALLDANFDQPYTSTYTLSTAVPYAQVLSPGAAFTGRNLTRDLRQVMDEFAPTRVLAPAPEDRHPDHAASGRLALQVLAARGKPCGLWHYVVHAGDHWPEPRGLHKEAQLAPPPSVTGRHWLSFTLTDAEQDEKLLALRAHRTQMDAMPRFLESFVRRNELFAH